MQDLCGVSKNNRSLRIGVLAILIPALTLCFLIMPVMAHAPTNISFAYNPDLHKLYITITHPVDDPKTHYVRWVQVKINGEVISDPLYKSQPGKNSFTYTYDVMANPEDAVWVVATCVNGQSLEAHYDIPRPFSPTTTVQTLPPETATSPPVTATAPPTTGTTYAAPGPLPPLGAAAVLVISKKIKKSQET
jgi:hypothetical protein